MKTLCIFTCTILLFVNIGFGQEFNTEGSSPSGWLTQSSQTQKILSSVYFINANEGFAVGTWGTILSTSNGGTTWSKSEGTYLDYYDDIIFLKGDPEIGYIFGYHSSAPTGRVLKTTDQGETWDIVGSFADELFYSGFALEDNNTVVTVGDAGIVYRSTDGGEEWESENIQNNLFRSITFVNSAESEFGIIVGYNGKIYRTANKGASWTSIESPTSNDLRCVHFPSENIGYACGYNGTIIKTTNSGISWSTVNSGTTTDLRSIFFSDNNTGYVVGNSGLIRKTFNGGNDWGAQSSPTTQYLNSVYFVNSNVGYIVGQNGTVLKTNNGGGTVTFDKQGENALAYISTLSKVTLHGNFPNPFNPSTNIKYTLTNNNFVSLKVYNSLGQEVASLVNEMQKPNSYNITFNGSNLSSGIYYYTLNAGDFKETRKIFLLK